MTATTCSLYKEWLYSDHDIFYRELISNGCDAITKLKKLDMMGEYSLPADYKGKIQVLVNPDEKTIKIIDNGLGMTADEVEEYISRIAFSGATDFIEKYKDKSNDDRLSVISVSASISIHGSREVTIDTLSYKEALHLYTGHVTVAQSTTWRMATWTTSEQRLLST